MSLQALRRKRMRKWITISAGSVFVLVALVFLITLTSTAVQLYGQSTKEDSHVVVKEEYSDNRAKIIMWGFAAAAFSTAVGSVGAGIAVGYVGSAALGAIGEKPELAAKALIYVGLAEGIAIYGLIISIMILTKL